MASSSSSAAPPPDPLEDRPVRGRDGIRPAFKPATDAEGATRSSIFKDKEEDTPLGASQTGVTKTLEEAFADWAPDLLATGLAKGLDVLAKLAEDDSESSAGLLCPTGVGSTCVLPTGGGLMPSLGNVPSGANREVEKAHPVPPSQKGAARAMELGVGNPVDAINFDPPSFPSAQYNFARLTGKGYAPALPSHNAILRVDTAPVGADVAKIPLGKARTVARSGMARTYANGDKNTLLHGVAIKEKHIPPSNIFEGLLAVAGEAIDALEDTGRQLTGNLLLPSTEPPPEVRRPEAKVDEHPRQVCDFRHLKPAKEREGEQTRWDLQSREELGEKYLRKVLL